MGARVRAELAAEKADAHAVLVQARTMLDVVEPPELRRYLDGYLAATAERIRAVPYLIGQPVHYGIEMARVIVIEHMARSQ